MADVTTADVAGSVSAALAADSFTASVGEPEYNSASGGYSIDLSTTDGDNYVVMVFPGV
jgi:hypothetical protein